MATKVITPQSAKKTEWTSASILAFARRRRFMTVSVFSWVIMVVLTIVVIIPQVQQIFSRIQQITAAEAVLSEKQSYVSSLESLTPSELEQANTVLMGALPKEKPVLPLLYSLDRLATTAQVSISNFQISPGLLGSESAKLDTNAIETTLSPNISSLPLQMDVSGGFENLSTFFKSLDDVVPLVQVSSIKFESTKTGESAASSSAQYSAEVDLSSLYMKGIPESTATTIEPLSASDQALIDKLSIAFAQREKDAQAQALQTSTSSGRTNIFSTQ